ncbi:hypothetical protein CSOJ01_08529 [Colletotrichum sojae]|uniref:Uncharacterized protein n=1 Tax=Colletotrichum sojae TaxID=2175907 RepID=A0A8H6J5I6_9PEZI|nr:hypothetical protein CSOJ01_08529 [Colletotrichum sojae]
MRHTSPTSWIDWRRLARTSPLNPTLKVTHRTPVGGGIAGVCGVKGQLLSAQRATATSPLGSRSRCRPDTDNSPVHDMTSVVKRAPSTKTMRSCANKWRHSPIPS